MLEKKEKKLITTAIAYSNALPHLGYAFEWIISDVYARYCREKFAEKKFGESVYFTTGMDEHGFKIYEAAKKDNIEIKSFLDNYAKIFEDTSKDLNISVNERTRTTDEKHIKAVEKIWNKFLEKGDLEKRFYKSRYCIGCEKFLTEKDLNENQKCIYHPDREIDIVEEENYFFKLSKYKDKLKELIENKDGKGIKILPDFRKEEILNQLEDLEDISFSRKKEKVLWGISVPEDEDQIMYVWPDALSSYITNDFINYGRENFKKENFENTTHIIGKDIAKFHCIFWPAILMSLDLPTPKEIIIHGFITNGGQKMSKSLGNVLSPIEILEELKKYCGDLAGDALRFILLHEVPTLSDGDITMEQIKNIYNAHLANGFGNLTSRIMTIVEQNKIEVENKLNELLNFDENYKSIPQQLILKDFSTTKEEIENIKNKDLFNFNFKEYLQWIVSMKNNLDINITEEKVFSKLKNIEEKEKGINILVNQLICLEYIAENLKVIMPKTWEKIKDCILNFKKPEALFKRWE